VQSDEYSRANKWVDMFRTMRLIER